jgi:hypothetical protein
VRGSSAQGSVSDTSWAPPNKTRVGRQALPDLEFGEIVRERTGNIEATTHIWFDRYGARALIEYLEIEPRPRHTFTLTKEGTSAIWSKPRTPGPTFLQWQSGPPNFAAGAAGHRTDARLSELGYRPVRVETLGGVECELWGKEEKDHKLWRYRGLDIQQSDPTHDTLIRTTRANFTDRPSESVFAMPADLVVEDVR